MCIPAMPDPNAIQAFKYSIDHDLPLVLGSAPRSIKASSIHDYGDSVADV